MAAAIHPHEPQLEGIPQIVEQETLAEQQVRQSQISCEEEKERMKRAYEEERRKEESAAREQSAAALEEYERTELAKIVERGTHELAAHQKEVDAAYKKNAPAAINALVDTMVSGVFLS